MCILITEIKWGERHMDSADVFERESTHFHLLNLSNVAGNMIKSL